VWLAARNKIPGVYKADKVDVYRSAPLGLSFYSNCNDHAFLTAAHTLDTMVRMFGLSSSQVKNWLDAQDQVFDNCSDARPYFVSNPDAAPAAAPELPDRLKDGTPFERAQRTYQIACANFYSGNFDTAAKMFDAIAADTSSPWRQLAPYLVARATIRKATLSSEKNDHALLARAEAQLNNIVGTSDDDGVKHDARRLLGFVEAQLHPQEREEELARAVMLPTSGEVLEQDVSDYIWMLNNGPADNSLPGDDLTDWIATLAAFGQGNADTASLVAHSLEKWKATSSLAWLVAAISGIPASDPNALGLIESAEKIKPGSPAFATVTYHTARLLIGRGETDEAREKLAALQADRTQLPRSTVNEVAALRMSVARNLDELLVDTPRIPLGITDDADSDELPSQLDDQGLKDLAAGPLFDTDGASALTRGLPLSVLMQAARSQTLPSRLRGQVALATFIRAILLGNLPAARELAPLVMKSFPKLQPSIDAWLAAQDPDAQRFAAAFMMLQNPGLRFYVDPGPGRTTALNQIDSLRDNWWPSRVGQNLTTKPIRPSCPRPRRNLRMGNGRSCRRSTLRTRFARRRSPRPIAIRATSVRPRRSIDACEPCTLDARTARALCLPTRRLFCCTAVIPRAIGLRPAASGIRATTAPGGSHMLSAPTQTPNPDLFMAQLAKDGDHRRSRRSVVVRRIFLE
jgi:hypothetical protein